MMKQGGASSGDSSRDLSPVTADRMREMAYYLWQQNMLANRLIELPVAFCWPRAWQ